MAAHVLNTVLLGVLIARLKRPLRLHGNSAPVLGAVLFGFAPLAYEPVLWASALVHPLMTCWGLFALHAYVSARHTRHTGKALLAGFMLLLACLSHEMGFVFGTFILVIELAYALHDLRQLRPHALVIFFLSLVYPIIYRYVLITKWNQNGQPTEKVFAADVVSNLIVQMQAFVAWAIMPLRELFAPMPAMSTTQAHILICAFFIALVGAACALLWRRRLLWAGAFALLFWLIGLAPSSISLNKDYVLQSPRITYVPALGVAMFWGVALSAFSPRTKTSQVGAAETHAVQHFLRQPARLTTAFTVIGVGAWCIWSATYIHVRLNETERLTPALKLMDADLHQSAPEDRLLIINSSFTTYAAQPHLFLGSEGMPIWEYAYVNPNTERDPLWAWPASISGIVRKTNNDMHLLSLSARRPNYVGEHLFTESQPFNYGIFGTPVDDGALRAHIVQANWVYRFEYDAPGFRLNRLAHLRPAANTYADTLARLKANDAEIIVVAAEARQCGSLVYVDVTWANRAGTWSPTAVFVHGYAADGQPTLNADRDPVGGQLPLDQIPLASALTETREIKLTQPDPLHEIRLGIYDRASGKRFAATHADGSIWNGDEVLIRVQPVQSSSTCRQ